MGKFEVTYYLHAAEVQVKVDKNYPHIEAFSTVSHCLSPNEAIRLGNQLINSANAIKEYQIKKQKEELEREQSRREYLEYQSRKGN